MSARKQSRLQQELKQLRPFPSVAEEATVALMRTADVVRRSLDGVVAPHGISPQQYNVLRILRGAGEQGLPTLAIAERLVEHAPGITRFLDQLEARALISRARSSEDRRRVICRLTETGLAVVNDLDEPVARNVRDCLGVLTADEQRTLVGFLERIRTGIAERSTATTVPERRSE